MHRNRSWSRLNAGLRRLLAGLVLLCGMFVGAEGQALSVRLAWDPNTEPDIVGYRVYFGTTPDSYSNSVSSGSSTEVEVSGLARGVQYYFSVTAHNSDGVESSPSDPISYRAPVPPAASRYVGLFGEGESGTQGSFMVNVTAKGKASGRLRFEGKQYAWSGVFSQDGTLFSMIPRKGLAALILTLTITDDGAGLTGTFSDGTSSTVVGGKRATRSTTTEKSPYRGTYTAFLAPPDLEAERGYGYAAGSVSLAGVFRFAATLPDGARFAYAGLIDDAGNVPMHAMIPGGKGSLFGRVQFRHNPDESDADGELVWARRFQSDTPIHFRAARYTAQTAYIYLGGATLSIFPTVSPAFEGTLNASSSVVFKATTSGYDRSELRLTTPTGLFTGSRTSLGGTPRKFAGVVYLKGSQRGYGRLRDVADPGAVEITAGPGQ